jgi:UDP-glucose 4-epimerase
MMKRKLRRRRHEVSRDGRGRVYQRLCHSASGQEKKEVVIYDYDIDPRREILEKIIGKGQIASVRMIRGDITDLPHLIRTAQEFNITKIVHLAALLSKASSENPSLAVRTNCDGTANIFETARILRLEKLVYASSNTVFGTADMYEKEVISNDAPHYPLSVYGALSHLTRGSQAITIVSTGGCRSVGFLPVYGWATRRSASSTHRRTHE